MMCELSTLYKPSSASKCCWDDYGCRTLRRDRVTEHEGSAQHVAAVRASMSTPVNFDAQLDAAQQAAEDEAPNNSVHNNSQFPSTNSMPPSPLLLKPSTPIEQPPSSRCTCIVLPLTIPSPFYRNSPLHLISPSATMLLEARTIFFLVALLFLPSNLSFQTS